MRSHAAVIPIVVALATPLLAAEAPTAKLPTFRHHIIDATLPVDDGVGNYGQTAVADVDKDGRPDFILGRRSVRGRPAILYWYRYEAPDRWTRHTLGHDSPSDVGGAALDVDGDGWVDFVAGGAWFRNPQAPREKPFVRHVFDRALKDVHDVLPADLDGDGKPEIVTLHGGPPDKPAPDGLRFYKVPADPTQPWTAHIVGPGVHGAIVPNAAHDVDGDGDLDLVVADTWYENADARGARWTAHKVIPFGRKGPYGVCVRTAIADVDGNGVKAVVMLDADIVESRAAILRNPDGKGLRWERQDLPQSFKYGSLHALAVVDVNADGRPDIVSCEQEELLPDNRRDPKFVAWINLGPDASGRAAFREHVILDARLGGHELLVADFDGDGKPDVVSKPWGPRPWNGASGKFHVDFLHQQ